MADTTYTYSINNVKFSDGTTISGSWTVTYDSDGHVVSVADDKFTVTGTGGTTTFTSPDNTSNVQSNGDGTYQYFGQNSSGENYSYLYIDWETTTPSQLVSNHTTAHTTSVSNAGKTIYLDPTGNIAVSYAPATCFLAGSMIRTPDGDVTVEDIRIGDEITAFDWRDSAEITRKVVWVGNRKTTVRPALPDDEAGYPVRVLKDAIAEGVPFKDMLITAEHCLFFEDRFVPVRMLVNGRSIFYDKSFSSFEYYHIETDPHSVIWADGMLTESYLDTGNRSSFAQHGKLALIGAPSSRSWAEDAGAPLDVARDFVEPLFREIAGRAGAAGDEARPDLTDDADLRLVTAAGVVIRKTRETNGHVMFMIPNGVESVRLVSRASRPSDVVGPFVDDRRSFGVAVGEITLFESDRTTAVRAHLTEKELDGWHALGWEDTRWTSGNALLPLGKRQPDSVAILAIQIKAAGPYLAEETATTKAFATA
ncbi:Hint domain-containing protein [Acidomonas methanolica]|uniref:Hint domain-containing protein n=1 Tax=Acidomonas methanolica TaxID=437 RepID=UPI00277B5244|nr:Hint domain-containing protein [Acidomonas methanolica]MCQ9155535.1 Hint domain-containing protein [Acidomonas methanolica]